MIDLHFARRQRIRNRPDRSHISDIVHQKVNQFVKQRLISKLVFCHDIPEIVLLDYHLPNVTKPPVYKSTSGRCEMSVLCCPDECLPNVTQDRMKSPCFGLFLPEASLRRRALDRRAPPAAYKFNHSLPVTMAPGTFPAMVAGICARGIIKSLIWAAKEKPLKRNR